MLDELMDSEFWTDTMAWGIGMVVYMLFMLMIWKFGTMFGSEWPLTSKIGLTVMGVPLCYMTAKIMLDRGR